jgi:hypothetical protein
LDFNRLDACALQKVYRKNGEIHYFNESPRSPPLADGVLKRMMSILIPLTLTLSPTGERESRGPCPLRRTTGDYQFKIDFNSRKTDFEASL